MVSQNQTNTSTETKRNEAHRFLTADIDPIPLISGIVKPERAIMYHNESHRLDCDDRTKEAIKERMEYLKNHIDNQ